MIKKQITDQLPKAEEATTTEGLQALTRYEMERRKSLNRGHHFYKGSGRHISESERKERARKLDEKLARQAAMQPKSTQGSKSIPVTPGQSASPSPYLPRPPLNAGSKRRREDDSPEYFDADQSEPAAKRGRNGASPPDPRLQNRPPTPRTLPEDPSQQA